MATTEELISQSKSDMWDSGSVTSDACKGVRYAGSRLQSLTDYYWCVQVQNEQEEISPFSDSAHFATGILEEGEWRGKWVGCPIFDNSAASLFRREFAVRGIVRRARLIVSSTGYYELRINGEKVGENVLDPAVSAHHKRVLYEVYEVVHLLCTGKNALAASIGHAWTQWPQFFLELHLRYEDGSEEVIVTDNDDEWRSSVAGPIRMNSIYNGETYDARMEIQAWDLPNFEYPKVDDPHKGWHNVLLLEPPGGDMYPQNVEPIKVVATLDPISRYEPKRGITVFDLGQNIAGWVRIVVRGPTGASVVLRFAEILHEEGTINCVNLRSAQATDTYILKGQGTETYEPRFTYHGFRYVQVECSSSDIVVESLHGRLVRSSVQRIGTFECNNDLINRIHQMVVWTEGDNLHGVPTDCPQRDERLGWLNDMTVRAEEAIYNYGLERLYRKWVNDIADEQGLVTGAITDTAPFMRYGRRPADPVASSYLIVPWLVYLHYGDSSAIETHYDGFKAWFKYLGRHARDNIVTYSYYGDWASPIGEAIENSIGAGAVSARTPGTLMSTGHYYLNATILAKMARILDRQEDVVEFSRLAKEIAAAFNRHFLDSPRGLYASGSQASNAFPLYLGIVPEMDRERVLGSLVNDIVSKGKHLSTGNLCTKYVLDVLTKYGYSELAFDLVTQKSYPSWGYMIEHGATTTWERWEYVTGGSEASMASHNHPMYSTVGAWFYKTLAGLSPSEYGPGYREFFVEPVFVTGLSRVSSSIDSPRGLIRVACTRLSVGQILIHLTVPWNSLARLRLPISNNTELLESGKPVWQSGRAVGTPEGFEEVIGTEGQLECKLGSGNYQFALTEVLQNSKSLG